MEISISHDFKKLTRDLNRLQKKIIPKAAKRALNRTASQVKTLAAREISKETKMKVGQVKKHLTKISAQNNKLTSVVIADRYSPNLIEYMTQGQIKSAMARKGAGVKSRAWNKTKEYKGAFIGRGRSSGKLLVFSRTGSKRSSKVKSLKGPSVPRTFIDKQIIKVLDKHARSRFLINFEADLKYYISKIK